MNTDVVERLNPKLKSLGPGQMLIDSDSAFKKPNFLIRLWRGDVPLVITYWLFFFFPGFLWDAALGHFEGDLNTQFKIAFLQLTYSVFMCIAIWRSASKYPGKAIWKYSAKFLSLLTFVIIIWAFYEGWNSGLIASRLNVGNQTSQVLLSTDSIVDVNRELNADLPKKVDDETILESIKIGDDHSVTHTYSFIKLSGNEVSSFELREMGRGVSIIKYCKGLKELINAAAPPSATYQYYGNDGMFITQWTVTSDECK